MEWWILVVLNQWTQLACVVQGVADAADRRGDPGVEQRIGEGQSRIFDPASLMEHEALGREAGVASPASEQRLFQCGHDQRRPGEIRLRLGTLIRSAGSAAHDTAGSAVVADFTCVWTMVGFVDTSFVSDLCSRRTWVGGCRRRRPMVVACLPRRAPSIPTNAHQVWSRPMSWLALRRALTSLPAPYSSGSPHA